MPVEFYLLMANMKKSTNGYLLLRLNIDFLYQ